MPVWLGSPFGGLVFVNRRLAPPVSEGNYYNVMDYPGVADAVAAGTTVTTLIGSNTSGAIQAYKAGGYDGLYFPVGNYLLGTTLTVPAATILAGPEYAGVGPPNALQVTASMPWLRGRVNFSSGDTLRDLKIGPQYASAATCGLRNTAGATGVDVVRCHIRGGGASGPSEPSACTAMTLGDAWGISYCTFTACEVERSLSTDWVGSESTQSHCNTVYIIADGNTCDGLDFIGCHFGVSNGVAIGAQRMMVECWTAYGLTNWNRNLVFDDCLFEVSTAHQLDFACYGASYGNSGQTRYVTVNDCHFKGSLGTYGWGYGVCSESADYFEVTNNQFDRCHDPQLNAITFGSPPDNHMVVTGNVFDNDVVNDGVPAPARAAIMHMNNNAIITGNTFTYSGLYPSWTGIVELNGAHEYDTWGCTGNVVTDNVFNHNAAQSLHIAEREGAIDNTMAPNTYNHI